MDTLTNPAKVRIECNLPTSISDDVLQPFVEDASIEMRKLLTTELYDQILNDGEQEQRKIECRKAESIFAFVYALPYLNIETSGSGIVNAKGWGESRSELMSVREMNELADKLRAQAMRLLGPYLPVLDDDVNDEEHFPIHQGGGFTMISV